jgi:hypothetical protein
MRQQRAAIVAEPSLEHLVRRVLMYRWPPAGAFAFSRLSESWGFFLEREAD